MTMTMCIVMTMNIYISSDNKKALKELKDKGHSMSGLVNHLLDKWRKSGKIPSLPTDGVKTIVIDSTPVGENEFHKLVTDKKSSPVRPPINKEGKDYSTCKHGAIKGFCKKGCK